MKIKFWGARGSIPVSGRQYLKYGGSTTCVEIRSEQGDVIIVDAGSGIRLAGNRIMAEGITDLNFIFTHSHWDHILGFPFFKPLYSSQTRIKMFGCPFAQQSVKKMIASTMEPPHFPVKYDDINARIEYGGACTSSFRISTINVTPIVLSHPNRGIGYKFEERGKTFVFLTDNELGYVHPGGLGFDAYLDFCSGADLLVHDAEFVEQEYQEVKTWGHSTCEDAVRLALGAGVKTLALWHHNQDRTDSEIDEIVRRCRQTISETGSKMECFTAEEEQDISL
jgi:phosphoribosyl 1,2-cyclic phosphodiesterase